MKHFSSVGDSFLPLSTGVDIDITRKSPLPLPPFLYAASDQKCGAVRPGNKAKITHCHCVHVCLEWEMDG